METRKHLVLNRLRALGGWRVQGRMLAAALALREQTRAPAQAGSAMLVL